MLVCNAGSVNVVVAVRGATVGVGVGDGVASGSGVGVGVGTTAGDCAVAGCATFRSLWGPWFPDVSEKLD